MAQKDKASSAGEIRTDEFIFDGNKNFRIDEASNRPATKNSTTDTFGGSSNACLSAGV